MITRTRLGRLVVAGALGMAAIGCASDDGNEGTGVVDLGTSPEEDAPSTDTSTTDAGPAADDPAPLEGAEGTEDDEAGSSGPEVISMDDPRLSDGTWAVGEAGTVEFAVRDDGTLELVEAIPADGWAMSVDVDAPDEIEVDFERGEREYEIEVEVEGGVLEVEIDLDIDPAQPGPFDLGPAGTVDLTLEGGAVVLADLTVADGWEVTEQDTDEGEVEVELRQGPVRWDLDAEVDDGRLEVEIDFQIEGALQ